MRALTAALGICAVFLATGASAQTINDRLKAVEKKTGYFSVKRSTKSKSWTRQATVGTRDVGPTPKLVLDLPLGGTDPVIANVWLTITGDYTSDRDLDLLSEVAASLPNGQGLQGAGAFCTFDRPISAGSGTINFKVFCSGVVNPQMGEGVEAILFFRSNTGEADLSLTGLTATTHVVSQVITEPPQ